MESYFTDRSMMRVIHRERAVGLYGPRALLMQAAHPLAVAGLLAHSDALEAPYDRLARTAEVMTTIGFGTRTEADRITRRVRAMHRTVSGTLDQPTGRYPAGTPYRADDPELLLWVLFTLVDSGIDVYSRYVRSLDREQRAAYWRDYRVVGRLFGLADSDMPDTLADLEDYRHEMFTGDTLHVSDWARTRARQIVMEPPVPLWARPLLDAANFTTIALLPDRIREMYGFLPLPPVPLRKLAVAGGAEYAKRLLVPFLPDRLRLVPAARA